jgi:uncharacterized protein YejL (UPF0352 family)
MDYLIEGGLCQNRRCAQILQKVISSLEKHETPVDFDGQFFDRAVSRRVDSTIF